MDPFELFKTSFTNPLSPEMLTGQVDPSRLMAAAAAFPGGVMMLVFALFWAPVGPGIPAGVLLARHAGINPALTLGLYTLSDLLGALVCHPLFRLMVRLGSRVRPLRWLGERLMRLALIGTGARSLHSIDASARPAQVLFRIATVGFGADVYHAGMMVAGLPIPRVAGWLAAIAGDLVWFAVLLGTSLIASTVTEDDRVIGVVVVIAMVAIPPLARRVFPALRATSPAPIPAGPVFPEPVQAEAVPAKVVLVEPVLSEPASVKPLLPTPTSRGIASPKRRSAKPAKPVRRRS